MAFNNVPANGWPQIKDLEKLDALAKQIEDMPTFTSDDRDWLDEWESKLPELPEDPETDGVKVLTATTEDGETVKSWETEQPELPADPETDGVRVLTATTEDGETVKSWETQQSGLPEIKTKNFTPQSTYMGSVTTYSDSDLKNVAIVGYEVTGIDMYNFAVTTLISDDTGTRLTLHNMANASITPSSVSIKYIEST